MIHVFEYSLRKVNNKSTLQIHVQSIISADNNTKLPRPQQSCITQVRGGGRYEKLVVLLDLTSQRVKELVVLLRVNTY